MRRIERLTDELWSSYLMRSLDMNDVKISDFKQDTYNSLSAHTEDEVLTVERFVNLENALGRYFVFGCFDRACLEERAFVTFPPAEDVGEYELEFFFQDNGTTFVKFLQNLNMRGLLGKYENNKMYETKQVINDLVDFAKDPYNTSII